MPQQKEYTFSIVVPLFNESENVGPLLDSLLKVADTVPGFLEIVLIDDGSTDDTIKLVENYSKKCPRISLVLHDRNRGLGAAIRTGLSNVTGDLILYTDADLPFDFTLIPELLLRADDQSIITGRRLNRGEGWRRLLLTRAYNLMIWLLFGLDHSDVNFACKILPKRFVELSRLRSIGSFIDAEIVLEARRLGFSIIDFPLVYYPRERGLSTLSRPSVIMFILREMLEYRTWRSINVSRVSPQISETGIVGE